MVDTELFQIWSWRAWCRWAGNIFIGLAVLGVVILVLCLLFGNVRPPKEPSAQDKGQVWAFVVGFHLLLFTWGLSLRSATAFGVGYFLGALCAAVVGVILLLGMSLLAVSQHPRGGTTLSKSENIKQQSAPTPKQASEKAPTPANEVVDRQIRRHVDWAMKFGSLGALIGFIYFLYMGRWKTLFAGIFCGIAVSLALEVFLLGPLFNRAIQEVSEQQLNRSLLDASNPKLRLQLIKHEGKRDKVYIDSRGNPTIGVGFNLNRADAKQKIEGVGAIYAKVLSGQQTLTEDQINRLFDGDLKTAISNAEKVFPQFSQLSDVRQRAITDMIFNLGLSKFEDFSKMITAVNAGDYAKAADEMQNSVWYGQVGTRGTDLVYMMRHDRDP